MVMAWYTQHSEGFDFIMVREWRGHARNISGFGQSENYDAQFWSLSLSLDQMICPDEIQMHE